MGLNMSMANNIIKMLIGIVVLIIGIVWYTGPSIYGYLGYWQNLIDLLKATIGLFLLFVGLIVAWMGYDDYKMDKEMEKEENKGETKSV
jgi:ABC-type tungstate transport system substrate-binding protein